ncbi:ATP-binding cassette domain-containing protein [Brevibacterium sp.]|uniref:ATP-binding cassette domain-containing protein n=1 Tax=Brevibacterium sp. TaxID=1701 RepID=UPI002648FA96|nr:ATP-binding cassette domain-containing protein [Brevibacterium sp.]MDN6605887.1 ATP-binding cassette domain-containing protein [Brevibacterium sp.]
MSDAILTLGNLHVSYGQVNAVRDVSITVPKGSLTALVGANGAGKTSILSAVSGLVRPKSGTTYWPTKRSSKPTSGSTDSSAPTSQQPPAVGAASFISTLAQGDPNLG